jgi:hypothetical protein
MHTDIHTLIGGRAGRSERTAGCWRTKTVYIMYIYMYICIYVSIYIYIYIYIHVPPIASHKQMAIFKTV